MPENYQDFQAGQNIRAWAKRMIKRRKTRMVELPKRESPPSVVYGDDGSYETTNTKMARLLARDDL